MFRPAPALCTLLVGPAGPYLAASSTAIAKGFFRGDSHAAAFRMGSV